MSSLYWERQEKKDGLCAVNCLNALLQGPVFNAVTLARYAQELDKEEAALLDGIGAAGAGENVDAAGNFSSQTLLRALQKCCSGLRALDSMHEEVRAAVSATPERENGFICNRRRHWIALRKIRCDDGQDYWFNLDSRSPSGPVGLDVCELAALLASLRSEGHTVLVVRGCLPSANREQAVSGESLEPHQIYLTPESIGSFADSVLDEAISHGVLDLAKNGRWDEVMSRLQVVEQQLASVPGQTARYVDYLPAPRRFALLHYAAHQGRSAAVKQLLFDFKAKPDLLTANGQSAADLASGPERTSILSSLARAKSKEGAQRTSTGPPAQEESREPAEHRKTSCALS